MIGLPAADPLPVVVRAYLPSGRPRVAGVGDLEPSGWSVVFDCETTQDMFHSLRFGAYQVRHDDLLADAGFFYEPETVGIDDLEILREFAGDSGLEVLTTLEFVDEILLKYAYDLTGLCIGFNLPFDISRIAHGHVASSTGDAFSFELSETRPKLRLRIEHRSASAADIRFVKSGGRHATDHRGIFADVATLGRAMTGAPHSLKSLARVLGTAHRKSPAVHGTALTPEYIAYCMNDVQVTWECYAKLRDRYDSYGLRGTPITRIASEASIGKAALREMGIRPWREVQPDFPLGEIAKIMSTYYGGRTGVKLRGTVAEVRYCDFLSMYPTACANLGLWDFVIAQRIEPSDATEQTRELLEHTTVEDLRDQELWRELAVLVEVAPDGDLLPVRAEYQPDDREAPSGLRGIAVNYLSSSETTLHYTLADCIASRLATGKAPRVVSATGYRPLAPQEGLEPLLVAGNPDYPVDPYHDDYYKRLIELRMDIRAAAKEARDAGDVDLVRRLDAEQQGIKICANGSSYGCFIELNPQQLVKPLPTAVFTADGPFVAPVPRREEAGRFFHPLLATLITGAARLLLMIAEQLAYREELDWAFMDTDSIAFTNPRDLPAEEFRQRVDRVRDWFTPLNPYRGGGDLLKLEDPNFKLENGQRTDEPQQLLCLATSPKRYDLFNVDALGRPILRKVSAHGLGHLLPPYENAEAPSNIPPPAVPLHELGVERWQYDLWYRAAYAAIHEEPVDLDMLPNLDRPAMADHTVTTPTVEDWIAPLNKGRDYETSLRPFGFFIAPITGGLGAPLGRAGKRFRLLGTYNRDADQWLTQDYVDIHTGRSFRISTTRYDASTARVRTYRQIVGAYLTHPDPKRIGPDGTICARGTRGILQPRHINAFHVAYTGKESNRLAQVGLENEASDDCALERAGPDDPFVRLVVPVLRDIGTTALARETGMSRTALTDILHHAANPQPRSKVRLERAANRHAADTLRREGLPVPANRLGRLYAYLTRPAVAAEPRCARPRCEKPAVPGGVYCADACKQAAYRERRARAAS
jgi:hypothetical protein